jgi:hypothetical protein
VAFAAPRIKLDLVPALTLPPVVLPVVLVAPLALDAFPVASCNSPGTFLLFVVLVSVLVRFINGLGRFSSSAMSYTGAGPATHPGAELGPAPIGRAAGPTVERRASRGIRGASLSDEERSRGGSAASLSCGAGIGALEARSSIEPVEADVVMGSGALIGVGMTVPESVSTTPRMAEPRFVMLFEARRLASGVWWFLNPIPMLGSFCVGLLGVSSYDIYRAGGGKTAVFLDSLASG